MFRGVPVARASCRPWFFDREEMLIKNIKFMVFKMVGFVQIVVQASGLYDCC